MSRQGDIILEKHSLNKLAEKYGSQLPCVRLVGTFRDEGYLYFL